jgi:uncharacterized repeat protein (TIGR01451 family)
VNAGAAIQYQIVVSNSGPQTATGVTLGDSLPSNVTGATWTSTATGGAAITTNGGTSGGTINDVLTLPSGSSITYTVNGTLSGTAFGTLSNTATATVAGGDTDTNAANNTSTVANHVVPVVDLSVTKSDLFNTVAVGQTVTYTIVVSNTGQTAENGATLTDTLPSNLTNVSYTSSAIGGATDTNPTGSNLSGSFSDTLNLPVGSSVTYTVTGTVANVAAGTLFQNAACVAPPSGVTDNDGNNDQATDTDTVQPLDLKVTKTDGLGTVLPGQGVTYTVTVSNVGGADVRGASLTDLLPSSLTGAARTSTAAGGAGGNTPSGTGNINETALNLPAGSSITYTVHATVASGLANGTAVQNTATVSGPAGTTDATAGNNAATDTDTVSISTSPVNLAITKTDNSKFAIDGQPVTYTITVTNLGTTTATGATVRDLLPSGFVAGSANWTSKFSTGAAGNSGTGDITDAISLAPGQSITYTLTATVSPSAHGGLRNTATVTPAAGVTDTDTSDNTATDRDTVLPKAVPAYFNQYAVGADAGAQGHVKVYSPDGTVRFSFLAFPGFNGGVRVATGDVNNDGINDIIVSAGPGAPGGHVKVFDGVDGHLIASFFSFENFLGGTNVAVGDVNNDGFADLIIGSGLGVGHVKVFSFATGVPTLLYSFFAYPGYLGGITVASGDVNGDGFDDIITGTADNAAHLKVFSLKSGAPEEIFSQIVIPNYNGGIDVAAGDIRGDSRAEFLAVPMSAGGGGAVQIFSIDSTSAVASFVPNFAGPPAGLRVAVADADGDGDNDIIVASGRGRVAQVQAYTGDTLALIKEFSAFDNFLGGVYIG